MNPQTESTPKGTTMKIDTSATDEAVVIMSHTFNAPRDLVWAAFTDPKHVVRWYGGHGFENPVCEMDVRPGGIWRHVMRTPDGVDRPLEFVFVEVKKPERLVWQDSDHGKRPPGGPPTCQRVVTLEDLGKRTKWTLVARFNTLAERDFAVKMGFTRVIEQGAERLDEVVKGL